MGDGACMSRITAVANQHMCILYFVGRRRRRRRQSTVPKNKESKRAYNIWKHPKQQPQKIYWQNGATISLYDTLSYPIHYHYYMICRNWNSEQQQPRKNNNNYEKSVIQRDQYICIFKVIFSQLVIILFIIKISIYIVKYRIYSICNMNIYMCV